jgi:hypothetical protein
MRIIKKFIAFYKNNPDMLGRIVLIIAVIGTLALAIYLSGPKPDLDQPNLPTPKSATSPKNEAALSNALPFEIASEFASTTGVTVGAGGIVLILLLGTIVDLLSGGKKE